MLARFRAAHHQILQILVCSGTQDAHTVVETTRTTVHITEKDSPGIAVEEIGSYTLQEKTRFSFSAGIVEEFSDGEGFAEARSQRLSVSRGVSIVSVSEDERTLSRNSSINDLRTEPNAKYDTEGNIPIKRESSLKESELEDQLSLHLEPKNELLKNRSGGSVEEVTVALPKKGKQQESSLENKPNLSKSVETGDVKLVESSLQPRKQSITSDVVLPKILNADISLDDDELDPEIDALLKRVQRQRSVLQEILEKEKSPVSDLLDPKSCLSGEQRSGEPEIPIFDAASQIVNTSSASAQKTDLPKEAQNECVIDNHDASPTLQNEPLVNGLITDEKGDQVSDLSNENSSEIEKAPSKESLPRFSTDETLADEPLKKDLTLKISPLKNTSKNENIESPKPTNNDSVQLMAETPQETGQQSPLTLLQSETSETTQYKIAEGTFTRHLHISYKQF